MAFFGLQLYTSFNLASLGTTWYTISGLIPAKKRPFTLKITLFIPICEHCCEKYNSTSISQVFLFTFCACEPDNSQRIEIKIRQ